MDLYKKKELIFLNKQSNMKSNIINKLETIRLTKNDKNDYLHNRSVSKYHLVIKDLLKLYSSNKKYQKFYIKKQNDYDDKRLPKLVIKIINDYLPISKNNINRIFLVNYNIYKKNIYRKRKLDRDLVFYNYLNICYCHQFYKENKIKLKKIYKKMSEIDKFYHQNIFDSYRLSFKKKLSTDYFDTQIMNLENI